MRIGEIAEELRTYRGVTRKAEVSSLARELLTGPEGGVIATYAEDAAAIEMNGQILLLAADGIMEDLVRTDPYWAGYCSVLVNVNDIAAMGGAPIALVDVMSCGDPDIRAEIVRGMRDASDKVGVPIVGGHLHPDTSYCAVDVAVLGETDRSHLVLSSSAKPDDSIVFVMDLDGSFTPGIPYSWDTTSSKDPGDVRRGLMAVHAVAPMVTAGKDISNPGAIGTLGMLLEASNCGGVVSLDKLPRPGGADLLQWLKAYQGCGFVLTAKQADVEAIISECSRRGLDAAECGRVTADGRLVIETGGERADVFDFSKDSHGCRVPQRI
ncbi:TPA: methanogenesis marker 2 protein [Thermoplasmata archaeon]|nr:methanogenesis marker 2 protein [Thermoplasmata archaeon]